MRVVLELDILEADYSNFLILIIEQRGIRWPLPISKQKHLVEIKVSWNNLIFQNYFLIQLGVWVKFRIDDHSGLFHLLFRLRFLACGLYLCESDGFLISLKLFVRRGHIHIRLLNFKRSTMIRPYRSLMEHFIEFGFCIRKPDALNFLSSDFPIWGVRIGTRITISLARIWL